MDEDTGQDIETAGFDEDVRSSAPVQTKRVRFPAEKLDEDTAVNTTVSSTARYNISKKARRITLSRSSNQ